MVVEAARVTLLAPWARSLKDKRAVVKSLVVRTGRQFGLSVAEVDAQDVHKHIVLGLACVSASGAHARKQIDAAIAFLQEASEAEVTEVLYQTW